VAKSRLWAVLWTSSPPSEVKAPGGRASKLQEYTMEHINKAGGTAVMVTSLTDVIKVLEAL